MLDRLRSRHPAVTITAYDGHYSRIGDDHMHVVDHVVVEHAGRRTTIRASEAGRRKKLRPKEVEARLDLLIGRFTAQAKTSPA